MPRVEFRSQDGAVADAMVLRTLERMHGRPRAGDAVRRVPAREITIAGVERVLAEHDVLPGDVLLVGASAIVVTDDAGARGRPRRPVGPATLARQPPPR